jgi:hypothetical protein
METSTERRRDGSPAGKRVSSKARSSGEAWRSLDLAILLDLPLLAKLTRWMPSVSDYIKKTC